MKTHKKGFTLIELLIVIAIIGLLSGIVLVSLGQSRDKALDAKTVATINNINKSMEIFNSYSNRFSGNTGVNDTTTHFYLSANNGYNADTQAWSVFGAATVSNPNELQKVQQSLVTAIKSLPTKSNTTTTNFSATGQANNNGWYLLAFSKDGKKLYCVDAVNGILVKENVSALVLNNTSKSTYIQCSANSDCSCKKTQFNPI